MYIVVLVLKGYAKVDLEKKLQEAVEILNKDNTKKIKLDLKKLIQDFKEYKNVSESPWEGNHSYFLNKIISMMGLPNEPTT